MRHASARLGWTGLGFLICSLADVLSADAQLTPSAANAVTVDVQPAANTHGWHATPVSIVFRCGDVSGDPRCRPPVVIDRDGANQRLDLGSMAGHAGRPRAHDEPADVGALIGLQHGVAATVVVQRVTHTAGCSAGRPVPGLGRLDVTHRLVLMRITAEGVEPVSTVWEWHDQGPDTAAWLDTVQSAVPGPLVPSGDHGMLVFWGLATGAQPAVMHVTSVTSASQRDVVPVPQGGPWQTMLLDVFKAPAVTLSNGQAIHALDLETGRTRRVAATAARLVFALADDGHVVVNDEAQGTLVELDSGGGVATTWALGLRAATVIVRDSGVIHGLAVSDGAFLESAIDLPLLGGAYAVLDIDALAVPSPAHAALVRLVR